MGYKAGPNGEIYRDEETSSTSTHNRSTSEFSFLETLFGRYAKFSGRASKKEFWSFTAIAGLLFLICVGALAITAARYNSLGYTNYYAKRMGIREKIEIERIENEIERLKQKNSDLESSIDREENWNHFSPVDKNKLARLKKALESNNERIRELRQERRARIPSRDREIEDLRIQEERDDKLRYSMKIATGWTVGITIVAFIFFLCPFLAVSTRRLHDSNKRGARLFINFIPIIGQGVLIGWMLADGDKKTNRFGDCPTYTGGRGWGVDSRTGVIIRN